MSSNVPLVNVIVSSFNRPKLIRDALDSIVSQTWPNIGIIVADDYSDNAVQWVLRDWNKTLPARWKYGEAGWLFRQPAIPPTSHERQYGQRCAVCINAAMPYVHGDFIAYLPDDDWLPANSIEVRARYLMAHLEVNAVFGRLEACKSAEPVAGVHFPLWVEDQPQNVTFNGKPIYVGYGHSHENGIGCCQDNPCHHDRNGFWSAEPITRAANKVDHGMMMVRRVPNLPAWPEQRTAECIVKDSLREILATAYTEECEGEIFDCPDAGFFFRLELAGLGPFHSVPDVVVCKRYHTKGHRTDPSVRE